MAIMPGAFWLGAAREWGFDSATQVSLWGLGSGADLYGEVRSSFTMNWYGLRRASSGTSCTVPSNGGLDHYVND